MVEGDFFEYKIVLLKDIVYGYDFDIICFIEIWLNDFISNYEILLIGYDIFWRDREDCVGGGIFIVIKSYFLMREILVIFLLFEVVVVEIVFNFC